MISRLTQSLPASQVDPETLLQWQRQSLERNTEALTAAAQKAKQDEMLAAAREMVAKADAEAALMVTSSAHKCTVEPDKVQSGGHDPRNPSVETIGRAQIMIRDAFDKAACTYFILKKQSSTSENCRVGTLLMALLPLLYSVLFSYTVLLSSCRVLLLSCTLRI